MPYGSLTARSFALASIFGSDKRSGAPTTCYFALGYGFSSTVFGTEPTIGDGGYARVGILNDNSLWTITSETITNDVEIRWPLMSAAWTGATGVNQWAIYDAATAGTCWAFGNTSTSLDTSAAGRQVIIPPGDLDLTQAA